MVRSRVRSNCSRLLLIFTFILRCQFDIVNASNLQVGSEHKSYRVIFLIPHFIFILQLSRGSDDNFT